MGMQSQTTIFVVLGIVVSVDWPVERLPGSRVGAGSGAGGTNPVGTLFGGCAIWGSGSGAVCGGLLGSRVGGMLGVKNLINHWQKGLWGSFSS